MRKSNRRDFLKQGTAAGVGFFVAGNSLRAEKPKSPGEKLNVAIIGAGGQGGHNLGEVAKLGENIVALCDVDDQRAQGAYKKFPDVKKYRDFRKMLEEQKDIEAVVVSTPDHCHAAASIMAMKMGKHVYCEKPLTHSVYEARLMRETAADKKVATQMGNMGTADDGFRQAVEVIRSGIIGPIHEAHVWTNRPIWPQDSEALLKHRGAAAALTGHGHAASVPKSLDWDVWLGPAPARPYDPIYAPFSWRGWWDFGTGALGDMACHTMNMAFMALKLGAPTSVEAESSAINPHTAPSWAKITYEFPARENLPPVKLVWYEGKRGRSRVLPRKELFQGQAVADSGSMLVGEKGILYSPNDYGARFVLLPKKDFEGFKTPDASLRRVHGAHHKEWVEACKGGKPAMSNFSYAGVLTETVLLGNVALRAGKKVEWDSANLKITNLPQADHLLRREYRQGWTL